MHVSATLFIHGHSIRGGGRASVKKALWSCNHLVNAGMASGGIGRWIETWSGAEVRGGGEVAVDAPLHRIPVWVRARSIVLSHPAEHVRRGLGDTPESNRPLVATLWGEPRLGRAAARLPDGTRIGWRHGRWTVDREREVELVERCAPAG
jgi:hypothetical protein